MATFFRQTNLLRMITRMAVASTTFVAVGCGELQRDVVPRQELASKLAMGRRVAAPLAASGEDLGLTADDVSIVSSQVDAMTGAPTHLLYDTTLVKATSASTEELPAAALALATSIYEPFVEAGWKLLPRAAKARSLGDGLNLVSFSVSAGDLAVRDGTVDVYFVRRPTGEFVVREFFARHPVIPNVTELLAGSSALDSNWAERIGLEGGLDEVARRTVIFPRAIGLDVFSYELADEVRLRDAESGEVLTVTVGAREGGEVLEAYSDRLSASSVAAKVLDRSYRDPPAPLPLSFARIVAGGQTYQLDALGGTAETLNGTVSVVLQSGRASIVQAGSLAHSFAADIVEGRVELAPAGNNLNAVNAFLSIQRINTFARRHLEPSEVTILQREVPISINVAGSCNAFYDFNGISLFAAGQGCANMAQVNDVIYHEWGHGLDDFTGIAGGITDGPFSEGIGDIVSAYYSSDSNMGLGFFTNTTDGVRNLQNTSRFPDQQGPVHQEGTIIGGAFWDLRVKLVARYGETKGAFLAERLFMRHLLITDTYRKSYDSVLLLDDDDANAATRSPNHCLITEAFAAHGLASPIADCVDDTERFGYEASTDLFAGVFERMTGGVRLMASAGASARMLKTCIGDATSCSDVSSAGWKAMKLDGKLADGRIAFVDNGSAVAIPDGSFVWLAAYDEEEELLGRRTVKVVSR